MATVDLLYSDNPRRRDEVVRLSSKLHTLMESNFKRVNELIDCIHKYIPGMTFRKIKLDERDSIKNNCKVIKKRMDEIESFMTEKMQDLKSKIDQSLFDKLMNTDIKFIERVRLARNIVRGLALVGWTIGSVLLIYFVKGTAIFTTIAASITFVGASMVAVLGLGILIAGVDLLISAIIGAIEKHKLEKAIKELKEAINTFEPASDKFNRDVERLIIRIEDAFED